LQPRRTFKKISDFFPLRCKPSIIGPYQLREMKKKKGLVRRPGHRVTRNILNLVFWRNSDRSDTYSQ
jgi:hypothetical protein